MVDWLSLAVPLAYLGVLIGSLATFSSLYRKRKAQKAASLAPWFPAHLQRDIYFSLLHLDPSSQSGKKTPNVPESVLKAALLRRATEDIRRVMALRNQKQALSVLLQRGSVGDDLWQRFMRAEKEMEEEVRDVVSEANAYAPNWGQTIFQSANEMMNNDIYRQRIKEHEDKLAEEREWWEKKRASMQEGFMKELNEGDNQKTSAASKSSEPATHSKAAAPAAPSVQGSDDDAVLVEADPSGNSQASPGGEKKKKGKGKGKK
ncbi:Pre protein translocase subunit Sec66-domain-containing protein [Penicillium argentinense]|uniref:Pre protein translocase subunit Sec66-domain-containing protein n=1 Tax=Penicillium argentinense TaxID=1131581 RepID=A0A9W9EHQ8_9EURO|nr:Pre protein translocase subunit Sec66-domain-containing protein [Penicillium argentinense]KAJ5082024.1 Pre protein translocase subunit Sec66-domain-containing protein [Penicillium argentinense]